MKDRREKRREGGGIKWGIIMVRSFSSMFPFYVSQLDISRIDS